MNRYQELIHEIDKQKGIESLAREKRSQLVEEHNEIVRETILKDQLLATTKWAIESIGYEGDQVMAQLLAVKKALDPDMSALNSLMRRDNEAWAGIQLEKGISFDITDHRISLWIDTALLRSFVQQYGLVIDKSRTKNRLNKRMRQLQTQLDAMKEWIEQ